MKLTLLHDGQFWIGIAEEMMGNELRACRYIFGAEPPDQEVLDFVNHRLCSLLQNVGTGLTVTEPLTERKISPKRLIRMVAKEIQSRGISTKAQAALSAELEQRKTSARIEQKIQSIQEKEQAYMVRRQKAKAKHKGH